MRNEVIEPSFRPAFPTAFFGRLLMNILGDLAAKSTAVSFPNPMALCLFVGGG
jgi:hypothetical protein